MNILNAPHTPVLCAVDDVPAVVLRRAQRRLAAKAEVCLVLFMDVGVRLRLRLALAHELLGQLDGHIEAQHQIGLRQPKPLVLKIIQPAEKRRLLLGRQLAALMHGVGGRIAV